MKESEQRKFIWAEKDLTKKNEIDFPVTIRKNNSDFEVKKEEEIKDPVLLF